MEIARRYLEMVELDIDPRTKVENLGTEKR